MRWLLLDEIIEIRKGISAKSRSHIPAGGVSPEVLLIEMMAQTGGVLLGAENEFKDNVIFAKIDSSEFPSKGQPGETVEITASAESLRAEGSWINAMIQNSRGVFAKSRFMLVCAGFLTPEISKSITFHEAFLKHFKIREKVQ